MEPIPSSVDNYVSRIGSFVLDAVGRFELPHPLYPSSIGKIISQGLAQEFMQHQSETIGFGVAVVAAVVVSLYATRSAAVRHPNPTKE